MAAKPKRRNFTAEYRLRILEEADRCTEPGERGSCFDGKHCPADVYFGRASAILTARQNVLTKSDPWVSQSR